MAYSKTGTAAPRVLNLLGTRAISVDRSATMKDPNPKPNQTHLTSARNFLKAGACLLGSWEERPSAHTYTCTRTQAAHDAEATEGVEAVGKS